MINGLSLELWKASKFITKHQNSINCMFDLLHDTVENESGLCPWDLCALRIWHRFGIKHTVCIFILCGCVHPKIAKHVSKV